MILLVGIIEFTCVKVSRFILFLVLASSYVLEGRLDCFYISLPVGMELNLFVGRAQVSDLVVEGRHQFALDSLLRL